MVTNKHNIPEAIVKFAESKEKTEYVENRYSVTELLLPTREIQLLRLHNGELEEDVSDMIMALFGTAAHKILEENAPSENAEVKFETQVGEFTIVGVADLITEDAIEDYKFTTTTKVQKQDFEDYRKQGLIYAWLNYLKTGDIKRKLRFHMLLKDWSKIKANVITGYPTSPIYTWEYNIQDSDYDYIEKYVKDKLADIKDNKNPQCSDEERWFTGNKYAVFKKTGDTRAAYVADTEEDAHNYSSNKCGGAGEIQMRPGDNIKCKYYCKVSKYCYGGK